jgi:hypothetical protein
MLAFMEQCLNGVHGIVKDAITLQPIEGVTVTVQNHDALGSWVTSHTVGDFHRPIKGGSYTFKFTKEGYCSEAVDVTVADGEHVDLNVYLSPSGSCPVDCYEEIVPSASGSYIMGYRNGNTLVMPTNNDGSSNTTSVTIIPNEEGGFSVEQGEIESPFTLTSTETPGQYYISYNGYYLTRSTSGWGSGNKAISWSTSQSNNNLWTISSDGISQTSSSGWGGSTTYYLFYNNGSFYTGTNNANNITFYQEIECQATNYIINVTAAPNEGGVVTGGGSFEEGETCTVSATANSGYTFENWTENGDVVSTNATYTFIVNNDRNLIANFTENPPTIYTVTVSANPDEGGTVTGGGTYEEGEPCTVIATPNNGYTFDNWTEDGNVVSSDTEYTFIVSENRSFVANFTFIPLPTYDITVTANPSVGGSVSGGGTFEEGQPCTVIATANNGYTFDNWTENGNVVSSDIEYTFFVSENRSLVANFTPMTYTIRASANPTDGGEIFGGGTYAYGTRVSVKVVPNENYIFMNWTENGDVVSEMEEYFFEVTGGRNLVANLQHVEGLGEQAFVGFSLYPIPVGDKLTVEASETIDHIEIFNTAGSKVFSQKSCGDKVEIHTADLPAGTYVIRMTTKNATEIRRFVKK